MLLAFEDQFWHSRCIAFSKDKQLYHESFHVQFNISFSTRKSRGQYILHHMASALHPPITQELADTKANQLQYCSSISVLILRLCDESNLSLGVGDAALADSTTSNAISNTAAADSGLRRLSLELNKRVGIVVLQRVSKIDSGKIP